MKLVIGTQYCENYGSVNEPYWKFKGHSTYVVEGLTPDQAARAVQNGIPTLRSLIEYSNPMSREYVLDYSAEDDDYVAGEPWETPIRCVYGEGEWHAYEDTVNDEYGYMRSDIGRKLAVWTMLPCGERKDYTVEYYDRAGKIMVLEVLTPA